MGEGHIPLSAVDEMIRIVKPGKKLNPLNLWIFMNSWCIEIGGSIFIVMREEYLSYVQEYVGKLEPYMEDLAVKGVWRQV